MLYKSINNSSFGNLTFFSFWYLSSAHLFQIAKITFEDRFFSFKFNNSSYFSFENHLIGQASIHKTASQVIKFQRAI